MRLVSLCPSITESLVAFGLGDELVGITNYCIHPRDGLRGKKRVGGTKSPDVPGILALAPDLLFLNAEENRRADIETLSRSLRVDVSHPRTVAEVPNLLRRFGGLTDRAASAEGWAGRIEEGLTRLRSQGPLEPFRFVYLIWKDPWMAAAPGTYIDDVVTLAGGRNAVVSPETPYPVLSDEDLRALAPDVVLLPDEPFRFRERHVPEVGRLVPGARVRLLSGDDFCWHGVRTLRGIDAASDLAAAVRAG